MGRRKAGTLIPLEVRILTSIDEMAAKGDDAYGFSVASALSAQGGKKLTAHGTLYKALARLTEAGLLDAEWESPDIAESQGRPRRRLYSLTNDGKDALAAVSLSPLAKSATQQSFKPGFA